MTIQDFNNIVEHQVKIQLVEKDMKRSDLSDLEYLQWKYEISLKLLIEL